MKFPIKALLFLIIILTSCISTQNIIPGHAHNDYENSRPLINALESHFASIEVDVYLIENELIVSHNYPNSSNKSTIESLYLEPLNQIYIENQNEIYKNQKVPIILLVDIKSDAIETYQILKSKIKPYKHMLSLYEGGTVKERALKIIISGNRPIERILSEDNSYLFVDGRPKDLGKNIPSSRMPLISQNYRLESSWKGEGEMDLNEKTKLWFIIEMSHREGKKVRFWGSPDVPVVWDVLLEYEVDYINTDVPSKFYDYYKSR